MPRRPNREIDRAQVQLARLIVALVPQAGQAEKRVIEIPAVDFVAVLVLPDIGEIAAQRTEFGIVEADDAGFELLGQRQRLTVHRLPFAQRGNQGHLGHRIRIFGLVVGVDISMAVMA